MVFLRTLKFTLSRNHLLNNGAFVAGLGNLLSGSHGIYVSSKPSIPSTLVLLPVPRLVSCSLCKRRCWLGHHDGENNQPRERAQSHEASSLQGHEQSTWTAQQLRYRFEWSFPWPPSVVVNFSVKEFLPRRA